MKVAVLNNCVPFLVGGAEHLADALTAKLQEHGHQATLIRIPFRWNPPEAIIEGMLACRLIRLPNVDRVIALKFPAYYVPHENKVLWLLHQFRQAYDLWGTEFQGLPDTAAGRRIRDSIFQADNRYLSEVKKVYTNSWVTSARLKEFNQIDSEVLHPPLFSADHLHCREHGDFLFYPSRITASKRQHLAVESMRFVRSSVRLVIAGKEENPLDLERIRQLIENYHLEAKVKVLDRYISEDEKVDLLSRALGVVYIPYDEDSYGFVTLEAFESRKPVISCRDSGGTDIVVRDGQTGYVTEPDPRELAIAFDKLYTDKKSAREMGENGYSLVKSLDITWEAVIRSLTS